MDGIKGWRFMPAAFLMVVLATVQGCATTPAPQAAPAATTAGTAAGALIQLSPISPGSIARYPPKSAVAPSANAICSPQGSVSFVRPVISL